MGSSYRPVLGAIISIAVAGCTALTSHWVDPSLTPIRKAGELTGVAYFLPTGKIRITATRVDTLVTNSASSIEIITNLFSKQITRTNAPPIPTGPTLTLSTLSSTNTVVTNYINTNGVIITTNLLVSQQADTNHPASQAPMSEVVTQLDGTSKVAATTNAPVVTTNYFYQVTIEERYEPDRRALFLLQPNLPWTSSDSMRVSVGTNGLLSTVASTNFDKTAEIFAELAKAAAEGFKLAAGVPTGIAPLDQEQPGYPAKIDITFDPFDVDSLARAFRALQDAALTLEPDDSFVEEPDKAPYYDSSKPATLANSRGIYYKPLLPYEIRIKGFRSQYITRTVFLPNRAPVLEFEVSRAAFVQKTTMISLSNGCIAEVYIDKPSQALALAKTPLTILQAFSSLPTNILQLKFDIKSLSNKVVGESTNALNNQLALTEAQIKLLDAQRRLAETQRNLATPATTP
jgi:hypothetical protein